MLKVWGDHGSVLLTGDIEKQADAELLKTQPHRLPADILVVPHHGSRTSSTPVFIDTVAPDIVLFPVGYRNRFGLPNQGILSRYKDRGITTRLSCRTGATRVRMAQSGPELQEYRSENRRFWHNDSPEFGDHSK